MAHYTDARIRNFAERKDSGQVFSNLKYFFPTSMMQRLVAGAW